MNRTLTPIVALFAYALFGCAGNTVTPAPSPAVGPIMIDLSVSNPTGNADATPYDEAHLLRVITLNARGTTNAFARVDFGANSPNAYRSMQLFFPPEKDLLPGTTFDWDDSDNESLYHISVSQYASDDLDRNERKGYWSRGQGIFTVTKKEGRVVTLETQNKNNQGSTMHDGVYAVRVGSVYGMTGGPGFQDVAPENTNQQPCYVLAAGCFTYLSLAYNAGQRLGFEIGGTDFDDDRSIIWILGHQFNDEYGNWPRAVNRRAKADEKTTLAHDAAWKVGLEGTSGNFDVYRDSNASVDPVLNFYLPSRRFP